MQTIPDNIDLLLPCGEALRGFMEQPFLSSSDLKRTLRSRGIFLSRTEKRDTIPILVCCLLSPQEFDDLRECQATREDNPKTITRTIAWRSNRPLLEAIPKDFQLADLVLGDFKNYKVIGTPIFVPVANNLNDIVCEFEIEREDYSKNWAATKCNFKGKLRIEKLSGSDSIRFVLVHTAEETKELNGKFVWSLTQHFKDNGDIGAESEIETILFSSFDNEGRIAFFRKLTSDINSPNFVFSKVTDFSACPDGSVPLPPELKWMEDRVNDLKINGTALEETFFFKEKEFHKFFLFYAIEAKFQFDCPSAKGNCSVVFEFPDFASKKETSLEFEANISSLTLDGGCSHVNKSAVKEELLRAINDNKLLQFEKFRHRPAKPVPEVDRSVLSAPVQLELTSGAGG